MTDTTDHRAEAEKWLGYATEDDFVDVPDMTDVVASALIGIGHALLALGQEYRITPPNPADIGTTTWHGEQQQAGSIRTFRDPYAAPPLSPSEG